MTSMVAVTTYSIARVRSAKKDSSARMTTTNKEVMSSLTTTATLPNPRRVAAGRLNRLKRKGLTPEGRERLRQTALRNQAWRFSTGPRTPEGKAKVALNGKAKLGPLSVREIRAQLAELRSLAREMEGSRQLAGKALVGGG